MRSDDWTMHIFRLVFEIHSSFGKDLYKVVRPFGDLHAQDEVCMHVRLLNYGRAPVHLEALTRQQWQCLIVKSYKLT